MYNNENDKIKYSNKLLTADSLEIISFIDKNNKNINIFFHIYTDGLNVSSFSLTKFKISSIFFFFFFFSFLFFFNINNSFAKKDESCLIQNGNEIKYNIKNGKNCVLLRSLDNQMNKLTDEGMEQIVGKPCKLTSRDNFLNAEDLNGKVVLNDGIYRVKCNDGYDSKIILSCKEGVLKSEGDIKCTLIGCKKYDHNILNVNLKLIADGIKDNISENDYNLLLSNNDNKLYNDGSRLIHISCIAKTGYSLTDDSVGYDISCDRKDQFKLEGKCEYVINKCNLDKETLNNEIGADEYDKLKLEYSSSWKICTDGLCSENIGTVGIGNSVNYDTYLGLNLCSNDYSVLGVGNTVLYCNADGKWELKSSDKRCFYGCFGKPNLSANSQLHPTSGNLKIIGTFLDSDANAVIPTNSNISLIYAASGSMIDASCASGFTELRGGGDADNYGGQRDTMGHYYYCDGNTWKSSGSCLKVCRGAPSLSTGSQYYGNINYSGTFYNIYKVSIAPNTGNIGSLYATNGAMLDASCNNNYNEAGSGGNCNGCGGKGSWGHYYYCDNGTWKVSGSCKLKCKNFSCSRSCSNKFGIFNCEITRSCTARGSVLDYGASTTISCSETSDNSCVGVSSKTVRVSCSGYCGENGNFIVTSSSCSLN